MEHSADERQFENHPPVESLPPMGRTDMPLPPTFAEKDLSYYLRMIRGDYSEFEETQSVRVAGGPSVKNVVLLVTSLSLGTGKEEVGKGLLMRFLQALVNSRNKPRALILMNEAVTLALEESPAYQKLCVLEEQGMRIMICDHSVMSYGLDNKIKVGVHMDMESICDQLLTAWKVVSL